MNFALFSAVTRIWVLRRSQQPGCLLKCEHHLLLPCLSSSGLRTHYRPLPEEDEQLQAKYDLTTRYQKKVMILRSDMQKENPMPGLLQSRRHSPALPATRSSCSVKSYLRSLSPVTACSVNNNKCVVELYSSPTLSLYSRCWTTVPGYAPGYLVCREPSRKEVCILTVHKKPAHF